VTSMRKRNMTASALLKYVPLLTSSCALKPSFSLEHFQHSGKDFGSSPRDGSRLTHYATLKKAAAIANRDGKRL